MNDLIQALENKESPEILRQKILDLENIMLKMESRIELPINHHFADNLYGRELFIPAGVTLTGLIHKTEHLCVLAQGKVSVITDNGMKVIKAPAVIHSNAGTKRVLYAHEDSTWINFHHNPTNEKDESKLDDLFTVKTFKELAEFENLKLISEDK